MTTPDLPAILVGVAIGTPIGWLLALVIYNVGGFVLSIIGFLADEAFHRVLDYWDKRSAR